MIKYYYNLNTHTLHILKNENESVEHMFEISQQQFESMQLDVSNKKKFIVEDGKLVQFVAPIVENAETKRRIRNTLLNASDWTQLADSPLSESKRNEWKAYRQALRDISTNPNFPNVDFPTKPQ